MAPAAPKMPTIAVPAKISAAMLLLGVFPSWSYGYYDLLRLVVCGSAAYIAWFAKQQKSERLLWIMGFVAVLYNPFAPIDLNRGLWSLLNLAAAAVFWIAATDLKRIL